MLKRNVAKTASGHKALLGRLPLVGVVMLVGVIIALLIADLWNLQRQSIGSEKYSIEKVSSPEAMRLGLSGRKDIEQNQVMQFAFGYDGSHCMWMKDMNFAIDIVWLDANNRVVHIKESVRPETYPENFCSPRPARSVLEMRAGEVRRSGLIIGSQIAL